MHIYIIKIIKLINRIIIIIYIYIQCIYKCNEHIYIIIMCRYRMCIYIYGVYLYIHRVYTHIHIYIYSTIYIYIYMYSNIYIYIYIVTHIYIHSYIYIIIHQTNGSQLSFHKLSLRQYPRKNAWVPCLEVGCSYVGTHGHTVDLHSLMLQCDTVATLIPIITSGYIWLNDSNSPT